MKYQLIFTALAMLIASSCTRTSWTGSELDLIGSDSHIMRVCTVDNPADLKVLRTECSTLLDEDIQSAPYQTLCGSLLQTVVAEGGVGIAGPQVGISRRVVAVQRFDKPDEPFEVYPNIRIIEMRGDRELGPEGCLSVPEIRGEVLRSRDIDIQYTSPVTLRDTVETVQGFTAVIFQHECDHLDGIIFTDRI